MYKNRQKQQQEQAQQTGQPALPSQTKAAKLM
jgi:hypothetical protein